MKRFLTLVALVGVLAVFSGPAKAHHPAVRFRYNCYVPFGYRPPCFYAPSAPVVVAPRYRPYYYRPMVAVPVPPPPPAFYGPPRFGVWMGF